MISLETAKALKDAGLKWEPEYGDWYHVERLGVNPQIVAIRDFNHTLIFNGADLCTWLPRLDQLLAEIEKRNHDYRLSFSHGLYTIKQWGRYGSVDIPGKSPEESVAKALLRILESEGE